MKSVENKISLIIDLFFCIVLMPILLLFGPAGQWLTRYTVFFLLASAFLYGSYFTLKHFKVPQLFIAKKYKELILIFGILAACNFVLTLYPLPSLDFVTPNLSKYHTRIRDWGVELSMWLMFSLVMAYSLTTSLVTELYNQQLQKRRIEAQRNRAELAVFKAQISPHFLFNTLNSLYSLVIGTSEKAEDAFIKFTDILKYTYVTIDNETVAIKDEINYIGSYIDLQEIRLNSHTEVIWRHSVDNENTQIPPMLMLTFVENAFKYGASSSHDCRINISLSLKDGHLEFSTRNSIMKHAARFRDELPTGIENCRARLRGLYPGRHSLETVEDGNTFYVNLKIDLWKN